MAGREITRNSRIAIVGAGLSGAAVARRLVDHRFTNITVFDARPHVAGNAHTERCPQTGVMLHKYGPHIFHTDDTVIWNWFGTFCRMMPHIQRTKAIVSGGKIFSFPINLHTLNQFWDTTFGPDEAERYLFSLQRQPRTPDGMLREPANFEEKALSLIGDGLYHAFLKGYTEKAWGMPPSQLPASILARLPLRFNYDDNVFFHKHQGLPRDGYTDAVTRMLSHPAITLILNAKLEADTNLARTFDHTFNTGPIDEWFDYRFGPLPYRTLDFKHTIHEGDAQGCTVINNCDRYTPWTRSTEHKHFTPWEQHNGSVVTKEFSRDWQHGDTRYYPIRLANDKATLGQYQEFAKDFPSVTFLGRLGTYRYLDMDQCLREAIDAADKFRAGANLSDRPDFSGM